MANYPERGLTPYDTALKAYIDDADADVLAQIEGGEPGTEMGYAERVGAWTTTNTAASTPSLITGLTVSVTGTGRPVDVEFYAPAAYHSVASTAIGFLLSVNGALTSTLGQTAAISSPETNAGRSVFMKRRIILAEGTGYTFGVSAYGKVAGTVTLTAAGFTPIYLSVTAR